MMRTFQLTSTFDNLTVIDNLVLAFFRAHSKSSLLHLLFNTCKRHRNEDKIVADPGNLRSRRTCATGRSSI